MEIQVLRKLSDHPNMTKFFGVFLCKACSVRRAFTPSFT